MSDRFSLRIEGAEAVAGKIVARGKNWQQPKIIKQTTLPRSFNVFISSFSVESLSFSSEQ